MTSGVTLGACFQVLKLEVFQVFETFLCCLSDIISMTSVLACSAVFYVLVVTLKCLSSYWGTINLSFFFFQ